MVKTQKSTLGCDGLSSYLGGDVDTLLVTPHCRNALTRNYE